MPPTHIYCNTPSIVKAAEHVTCAEDWDTGRTEHTRASAAHGVAGSGRNASASLGGRASALRYVVSVAADAGAAHDTHLACNQFFT